MLDNGAPGIGSPACLWPVETSAPPLSLQLQAKCTEAALGYRRKHRRCHSAASSAPAPALALVVARHGAGAGVGLRVVGLPGLRVGREALFAHRQEVALERHPLAAARGRAVRGDEGPGLAVDHDVRDVQDGPVQVQEVLQQSAPASA